MLAGAIAAPFSIGDAMAGPQAARKCPQQRPSIEGQRTADLGDGTYVNPIVTGDHPDPTILKDGRDLRYVQETRGKELEEMEG
ncbi:xylan 1,4-beta-xylosidase [Dyella sp. OK004]|nr:xylan 1,4-beta-xylosidase [Dyella sp. OK004]